MNLNVSAQERTKLMRTLRWVLTATLMDARDEKMIKDIIERLVRLDQPPVPPKVIL